MTVARSRYDSSMSMQSCVRLSRPEQLPPFRLGDRDISLLALIARLRFPTSDQLARLDGGSARGVRLRLYNLFAHGYVDRPRQQYAYLSAFFVEGNRPLVYAITRKGARLLAERGLVIDHRLDWTAKNARATAPGLAHAIETAEAMIAFELACRAEGAPRLSDHHALLPSFPEATRAARYPFRLPVSFQHEGRPTTLTVVPDRVFSLMYPNGKRHNFCLELDRGTMDVSPRTKKLHGKSSIRKKLIGYTHARSQNKHADLWNFGSFRVLFITPSEKRLRNMLAVQVQVSDAPPGFFLYTTPARLAEHGVFGPAWITTKSDSASILQTPENAVRP